MFLIRLLCLSLVMISSVSGEDDYIIGPDLFHGTWYTCSSNTKLTIISEGSQFEISMVDTSAFKTKITIKNIDWDGSVLSFTSYCHDTDWTIHHKMVIRSKQQIHDSISGRINNDSIIWRKIKCQMLNGS